MKLKLLLKTFMLAMTISQPVMDANAAKVKIFSAKTFPVLLQKADGKTVDVGEFASDKSVSFECEPGTYIYSEPESNKNASVEIEIAASNELQTFKMSLYRSTVKYKNEQNKITAFEKDVDFTTDNLKVTDANGNKRTFTTGTNEYASSSENYPAGIVIIAQIGDNLSYEINPTDIRSNFAGQKIDYNLSNSYNNISYTLEEISPFYVQVPKDADVEISYKNGTTHYVPFVIVEPKEVLNEKDSKIYKYNFTKNSKSYCCRVKREGNMTRAIVFSTDKVDSIVFTDAELSKYSNHYFNHDVAANNKLNYADIFLNINQRGLLRMNNGGTFQIINLRTWQLTNNSTANFFIEPDYNYTVLNTNFQPDNSVIEVDNKGLITAKGEGTAIVQVRYDAISLSSMGGDCWSEIWAENTGTFVVTVGADSKLAPEDNIRLSTKPNTVIDSEHDILYYMKGEPGHYLTFKPADETTVTVANPLVDSIANTVSYPSAFSEENVKKNDDGSVTVLLTYGRNIIRTMDAQGHANYQVLSAKPITMEVRTTRDDDYILPGDKIEMQFAGLFHVAGKLAGIYNSSCHLMIDGVIKDKGTLLATGQYTFAAEAAAQRMSMKIPSDATDYHIFKNNCLYPEGYGNGPGGHRNIGPNGIEPNFNAGVASGMYGSIPDQKIAITSLNDIDKLRITAELGKRVMPLTAETIETYFGKDAKWETDNEEIITTVDGTYELAPRKAGTTMLTIRKVNPAKNDGPNELKCEITIKPNDKFIPVTGIVYDGFNPRIFKLNLQWGNWGTYLSGVKVIPDNATNKTIRYTSSDANQISVGKKGQSTDTSNKIFWTPDDVDCEAYITCETEDGAYRLDVPILVKFITFADKISIEPDKIDMSPSETATLNAIVTPKNYCQPIRWTSDNPEVATVDENGLVTAISAGKTVIKANVYGGTNSNTQTYDITAECEVTVSALSGVEDVENDSNWNFGPNPAESMITINSNREGRIEIYNMSGSIVISSNVISGSNSIDISNLRQGIYLIRLGHKTMRLIKK